MYIRNKLNGSTHKIVNLEKELIEWIHTWVWKSQNADEPDNVLRNCQKKLENKIKSCIFLSIKLFYNASQGRSFCKH